MSEEPPRRRLLGFVPAAAGALAGCFSVNSSNASLRTDSLTVSASNGTYSIEIVPEVTVEGDWEPFRNVSVIVKNDSGEVICQKPIGDLTRAGTYESVRFNCDAFPSVLTYEIDRDPCSQGTMVFKNVYDPEQDLWVEHATECPK